MNTPVSSGPAANASTQSASGNIPSGTQTSKMWASLRDKPLGSRLFSAAVSLKAPYFRTISPHVSEMEPGRCVVSAPLWWGVKNHIGTFHAIAACNLAEVAMGMLAEATVPSTHRWIPKGMTVQYKTKTKGGLVATAQLPSLPDFDEITEGTEIVVPVSMIDSSGVESVHADITIWVSPNRR